MECVTFCLGDSLRILGKKKHLVSSSLRAIEWSPMTILSLYMPFGLQLVTEDCAFFLDLGDLLFLLSSYSRIVAKDWSLYLKPSINALFLRLWYLYVLKQS